MPYYTVYDLCPLSFWGECIPNLLTAALSWCTTILCIASSKGISRKHLDAVRQPKLCCVVTIIFIFWLLFQLLFTPLSSLQNSKLKIWVCNTVYSLQKTEKLASPRHGICDFCNKRSTDSNCLQPNWLATQYASW
jgi:hypothetical protein